METTDHGYGDEFALVCHSRERQRVTAQALMCAHRVAVVVQVFCEQPLQMTLFQHDDMVEQLPAQRPDHPLDVGVLPATPAGGADIQNATGDQ